MNKLLPLILIAFSLLSFNSKATHVMGAEFEWEKIGQDTFKVTIAVYRDCNGVNLSATPINVSSTCGNVRLNTTRSYATDVTPICESVNSRCANSGSSFKYGIERYELTATFVATNYINNGCCEFTLSWAQCCRNGSITTGSANQNYYIESKFNACKNQNVKWNDDAGIILCLGKDASLDMGISSSDPSDVIKYSLEDPLTSASAKTTWSASYASDKPVYFLGFPKTTLDFPRGFHIDEITGEIRFRPMKEEISVICVKAEIYRNNKLIASVFRDVQMIIIKCNNNTPPTLSGFNRNNFATSYSKVICANKKSSFIIGSADNNTNDTLTLKFNGPIGSAKLFGNKKRPSLEWSWIPDSTFVRFDTSLYFSVTATDDNCPLPGETTRSYKVRVINDYKYDLSLDSIKKGNCGEYNFKISDKNNNPIEYVNWYINDSLHAKNKGAVFNHRFNKDGTYIIKALMHVCDTVQIIDTFKLSNIKGLDFQLNDTALCASEKVVLQPKVIGGKGNLKYWWTIDKAFNYKGKVDSSAVVLDLSKISGTVTQPIALSIEDDNGCKVYKEAKLTSKALKVTELVPSRVVCYGDIETLTLKTINGKGEWKGANVSNNEMDFTSLKPSNYLLVFNYSDDYTCQIDTALISYKALPAVDAGNDFNSCMGAPAQLLTAQPFGGNWNKNSITNDYFNADDFGKGTHTLIYTYKDMYGCQNEDTVTAQVHNYTPSLSVTDTVKACESANVIMVEASKSGGKWFGNGILSAANPHKILPANLGSGTFNFIYEYIDSNSCQALDTSIVIINEAPIISINILNNNIAKGDSVKIINNTNSQGKVNYEWKLGNPVFITKSTENFVEILDTIGNFDLSLTAKNIATGCIDTLQIDNAITVDNGNSVDYANKGLNIYPNPVNHILNISTNNNVEFISIYSIEGKVLLTETNANQINVSDIQPGLYILKIKSNNQIFQYRITKK